MPNAPETQRPNATGTSKTGDTQQAINLFGFVGLHQLAPVLEGLMAANGRPGRKSAYPVPALLACLIVTRIVGSMAEALKLLVQPAVWEQCRSRYSQRSGGALLPAYPPGRDQLRYFKKLLINDRQKMDELQRRFQRLAIGQARQLGNHLPGVPTNLACPDPRQRIYADGTVIAPYSDAFLVTHPITGEQIILGSRAKSPETARIQRVVTDVKQDGKSERGLNMVAVHTWTGAGRVVLATGFALGAEQWATLDLIDSLMEIFAEIDGPGADAVHTLVHDRAVNGWAVAYLMARHGIQVISKAVAGTTKSDSDVDDDYFDDDRGRGNDAGSQAQRRAVERRARRLAAEHGVAYEGANRVLLRRDILADKVLYHEPLPLGTTVYPTSRHGFELVNSFSIVLEPATHQTSDGVCRHPLAVDDGALFLTGQDGELGHLVKTRLLRCQRSSRAKQDDGRWATSSEYRIPCSHGDFTYTRSWQPEATRYRPDSPQGKRSPSDRVGWRLRPLSRPDDLEGWHNGDTPMSELGTGPFGEHFNRRNDSESFNQWFQRSLPHHSRAASESITGQELDFLLAAVLNNSNTWHDRSR